MPDLEAPTMAAPAVIRTMPSQCCACSRRLSRVTVRNPAKMTSVPRSIWKVDAKLQRAYQRAQFMMVCQGSFTCGRMPDLCMAQEYHASWVGASCGMRPCDMQASV